MRDLVKGNTLDEKMVSVERVLGHMRNRMHKTVTVATPPIPFSMYSQNVLAGNTIGAFMFPIKCVLDNFVVMIEGTTFRLGALAVTVLSGTEKHEHSFTIGNGKTALTFKLDVKIGDRVIFTIPTAEFAKPKDGQEQATSIDAMWISFLCVSDVKGMNKEEFLLDTVLKSEDLEVDK
jgi:hypothetical protein